MSDISRKDFRKHIEKLKFSDIKQKSAKTLASVSRNDVL
tara:strand:- start:37 stop:153 length:117 start_codon:yes stop_codon:yes gene_type:complete